MARLSFDLAQAGAAVKAGGVHSAIVRAEKGVFFVALETRESGVVDLVTKSERTPRAFRDPGQALKIVRELGVATGRFALEAWDTHAPKTKAWKRPDTAAQMKTTHQRAQEAEAYDAWFRAEVEQGVREADDPTIEKIPHDRAMAMLTQMRDAARAKSERAAATPAKRSAAAKVATTRQRTAASEIVSRKPVTAAAKVPKRRTAK
ncbi:hypothetical protein [Burkholderia sp. L27(2015)]|uniref:hypothetical protein n=1 Tax=Burkholderia sp. L27(2015) TaxID=1641858 RepID=UPI00131CCE1A|nr:hypothetical protein [Burkholderia sp. L27(2015)]